MKKTLTTFLLLCASCITMLAQDFPFKLSTVQNGQFGSDVEWYTIKLGNDYLNASNGRIYYSSKEDLNNDAYLWCFAGEGKKFHIYNKKIGANYAVGHDGTFSSGTNDCNFTQSGNTFYYKPKTGLYVKDLIFQFYLVKLEISDYIAFSQNPDKEAAVKIESVGDLLKARKAAEEEELEKALAVPLPFKLTTIQNGQFAPGTTFYLLDRKNYTEHYYMYKGYALGVERLPSSLGDLDEYLWAFVASDRPGTFTIYNKKAGTGKAVGSDSFFNTSVTTDDAKTVFYMKDGYPVVLSGTAGKESVNHFTATSYGQFNFNAYDDAAKAKIQAAVKQKEAENRAAQARSQNEYNAMIAKVGQANFNKLRKCIVPVGISIDQLNAYAEYHNSHYAKSEHYLGFDWKSGTMQNGGYWIVHLWNEDGKGNTDLGKFRVYIKNHKVVTVTALSY